MVTVTDNNSVNKYVLLLGALLAGCFVAVFYGAIENLFYRWGKQEELSHSYFIPLVSVWLLWERRQALLSSVGAPSALGVALMGVSMLLLGLMTQVFFVQHIVLWLSIAALVLMLGGRSLLLAAAFPVAYLVFMIPPPFWIITVTSWQFQLWSSELGVWMIRLFDIPVLLEGNIIDLGTTKLQVVEACSGLRYLFPFLSLAAIAGYMYRGPWWQRLFIFVSAVPITVLMNSVRIALTGVLSAGGDTSHTEGLIHFFEGWVVFILCIALLLLLMLLMARVTRNAAAFAAFVSPQAQPVTPTGTWTQKRFVTVSSAGLGILLLGAAAVYLYNPQPVVPERTPLANLNFSLYQWKPRAAQLDVATEDAIGADDVIIANLEGPDGEFMNLYIAYLDEQRQGKSWHSPRQCLPGGGWTFLAEEALDADAAANVLGHPYYRVVMKQGESTLLLYYWYQQRGRLMADGINMRLWLLWDMLTRQRSDGAMVRVMTEIRSGEQTADAEQRLSSFVNTALAPELDKHIPE